MIAARSGPETGMLTLAVYLDGRPCPDFTYDAAGTPCEPVLAGRCVVCSRDARLAYTICPQVLGHLPVESYVGMPLLGSQGQVLGLLAVANRTPLADPSRSADLLRIFSARAAAELERQETQRRQLTLEKQVLHAQKLESLGVLASEAPARPHLDAVERILHRASGLTGQMRAYSGRGHFLVGPLDLNGLLTETTAFMAASIPKKIAVDYRLEASLPGILADAAQVQQVVLNFLTNAADAIGDRVGTIQIRTDQVEANRTFLDRNVPGQDLQPGRYVVLEVRDSGSGIPPEVLPRIFEPFFTTKAQGRGLGLSVTLGILRGHRAGLCVRSQPGKGSTFQVLFPAGEPPPPPPPRPSPVLKALPGALVLVVDDEEVVRDATRKLVERLGLHAVTATDGLEAVEQVRHNPAIDLVLMDLTMPRMDGRDSCRSPIRSMTSGKSWERRWNGSDPGEFPPPPGHPPSGGPPWMRACPSGPETRPPTGRRPCWRRRRPWGSSTSSRPWPPVDAGAKNHQAAPAFAWPKPWTPHGSRCCSPWPSGRAPGSWSCPVPWRMPSFT